MDQIKILVVDDEGRMRKLVRDYLERKGFNVMEASDGVSALATFESNQDIELMILDVMMPFMDGYEVCSRIREYSKVPIILLTAKSAEEDELLGFELGIDEYITKPFRPKVLVARVEAILKRTKEYGTEINNQISYEGIKIDIEAHIATIDNEVLELSFKEFELLTFFLNHIGVALSRERILDQVWNYDYYGDARTIDTHIKKLRNKLGDKGRYIKTVWGIGYKMEIQE